MSPLRAGSPISDIRAPPGRPARPLRVPQNEERTTPCNALPCCSAPPCWRPPLAFADDLCTLNLQKISDQLATATTLGDPLKQEVQDLRAKAEQAKTHGDTEGCISASNMALQSLQRPNTDGASQ